MRLAEEGALLVCGDIDRDGLNRTAEAITAARSTVVGVVGDVIEPETARTLIATAIERRGRIEIRVNGVGGS